MRKSRFKDLWQMSKSPFPMKVVLLISIMYMASFNVVLSYLIQKGLNIALYDGSNTLFKKVVIILIFSCIMYIIISFIYPVFQEKLFQHIALRLKRNVLGNVLKMPLQDSQKKMNGEYMTGIIEDCNNCSNYICKVLLPAMQLFLNILIGIIYVFYNSWQLGCFIVIILPVFYLLNNNFSQKFQIAYEKYQYQEGVQKTFFEELHYNAVIIKAFSMDQIIRKKNIEKYEKKYVSAEEQAKSVSNMLCFTEMGVMFIELLVLVFGFYFVIKGHLAIGTLVGVWNAAIGSVIYPVSELPYIIVELSEQLVSWNRIKELVNSDYHETKKSLDLAIDTTQLCMNNVSFRFDNAKEWICESINFNCKKGDLIFIVGESGVGKSTLVKLLLSLYEPISGEVIIKSNNKNISKDERRNYISYVPQDNLVCSLAIEDNIKFGRDISSELICNVAKSSNIHDYIISLPKKYKSVIGKDITLSHGQAQRIAIARALACDTPFIIFDEPFSALDKQNTREVSQMIREISKSRGCIIITHDISMINQDDKVYVMKDGVINEKQ